MTQVDKPLVSVVMPCYNDGAYLGEAVSSISAQTWPNIELLIIDDGSDDGTTADVITHLDYPHLTILHTRHIGPAAARNHGIAKSKGKYILPLDADDTIEPTYIEKAVAVMERSPESGIVYCHADLFDGQTGPWELPDYNLKTELLDNCIFVTALFRKDDWTQVGGFCESFTAGMEDYDFWLSLIGIGRQVVQLPETLFHYRIKKTSRTTLFNHSYAQVQETYVQLYQRHKDLYARHMDTYCMELRRNLIDQLMINRRLTQENEDRTKLPGQDVLLAAAVADDPLVQYVFSIRRLKPNTAKRLDKLLALKNKIKRLLHRA